MDHNVTSAIPVLTYDDPFVMETCHLDGLFELDVSAPGMVMLEANYQTLSMVIAACVGFLSVAYQMAQRLFFPTKERGFRFHLVGIGRPQTYSKSQFKLLHNINTEDTLISVQTDLQQTSTITELKQIIKQTYNLPQHHDIVIIYSHHLVPSHCDHLTLQHFAIQDNALLTLAICDQAEAEFPEHLEEKHVVVMPVPSDEDEQNETDEFEQVQDDYESESDALFNPQTINAVFSMYDDSDNDSDSDSDSDDDEPVLNPAFAEPVRNVNLLFEMFSDDSDQEVPEDTPEPSPTPTPIPTWPRLGFDVITQEDDVMVHQMPSCGHEMNADSLYHYALSTFSDASNLNLTCPHPKHRNSQHLCGEKWHYAQIRDVLSYQDEEAQVEQSNLEQTEDEQLSEHDRWVRCAKLELLASRNLIENALHVQKCPSCSSLYYRNPNSSIMAMEDVKTVEDVETAFRFKCILCTESVTTTIERIPIKDEDEDEPSNPSIHNEDDIEEDIDGAAVNAMFADNNDDDDDDDDTEDDRKEDIDGQAINELFGMFEDDKYIEREVHTYGHEFCFCCGQTWESRHVCDSTFKADLVEILSMAETKKIGSVEGVPSIRCCPFCSQLIFHVDACKHMACRGCRKDFCFVCLKPKNEQGNWQCGSHSDPCPIAPRQTEDTLPNTIVLTKKSFQLFT